MLSFSLNFLRLLKAIKRSWPEPYLKSSLALVIMIIFSGTIFYHHAEGWGWIDSFYFSVTTMATVGYGDLAPRTDFGKIFTTVYIFVGVGVFVVLVSQFARALLTIERDEDR